MDDYNKKAPPMIHNPFKKSDCGCSFVCVMSIFLIIQVLYLSAVVDKVFIKDYQAVLSEIADEEGYAISGRIVKSKSTQEEVPAQVIKEE